MNLKAMTSVKEKVGLNSASNKQQFYWLLCLFMSFISYWGEGSQVQVL